MTNDEGPAGCPVRHSGLWHSGFLGHWWVIGHWSFPGGAKMCLGIPGRVTETYREHDVLMGKVDFGGVLRRVCLDHVADVRPGVTFCSFGDMLRVPGSRGDLLQLKSQGADVRVVYSPLDAVNLAAANPDRRVVFFAIGFETTAPPNAMAVWLARRRRLTNFSVLVSHVLVPPVITAVLESTGNRVRGFLGPGHVCTVMGLSEYEPIARRYRVTSVVPG